MDKLAGEFLRFARPGTLLVEEGSSNEVIESLVSLAENQATIQSVSIEGNSQESLLRVSVDGEQIK